MLRETGRSGVSQWVDEKGVTKLPQNAVSRTPAIPGVRTSGIWPIRMYRWMSRAAEGRPMHAKTQEVDLLGGIPELPIADGHDVAASLSAAHFGLRQGS